MRSNRRVGRTSRRLALVVLVMLLSASAAWLAWTALQARSHLERARAALPAAQAAITGGDSAAASAQLSAVDADAQAAFDRTHDPVWAVAAQVPVLGQPLATVRGLTGAVRELTMTGLPALASVADDLDPASLRPTPDRLDVQRLAASSGAIQIAADSLAAQESAVSELPGSWLPPVADARTQLLAQLTPLAGSSRTAAYAAQLLPPMLGKDGPRRYFVGFQNPAEARGTGGLLGAFAILTADQGRVTVGQLGANYQLPPLPAQVSGLDPEFVARYGTQGGTALWVNANVSPDFPEVARTWLAMWKAGTGQQLDGALAMDPAVLAALVRTTGPIEVAGLGPVAAERVEPLVLKEQYEQFTPTQSAGVDDERKDALVELGRGVMDAVLSGRADPRRLVEELGAVSGRHALVSSTRPEEQALLRRAGIDGGVPVTALPFAQAVVVNAAGGKLDTYLDTSLDYRVTRCTSDERTVAVTMALVNGAPSSGLPAYVNSRADKPEYPVVPGQNRTDLRLLATRGARLVAAELDGKPLLAAVDGKLPDVLPAGSSEEFLSQTTQVGRPSYGLTLELPPGATRTLELTLAEPPSTLAPELPLQNLARTGRASADVTACS